MNPVTPSAPSDSSDSALAPRPRALRPVPLSEIAAALGAELRGDAAAAVTGITLDSRAVREGDLYCALGGARAHGADFAEQAARAGACAALTDPGGADRCIAAGLPVLVVDDPRAATAPASSLVWGDPASDLTVIGVTGTNGKTSITTMLHRTLVELGRGSGVIGTSGTELIAPDGRVERIATVRTTPEAPEVHGILSRMREEGVQVVSMEVSSHAMVLHRADSIAFDTVCFTNLSQDHLDFHADMDDYFAAKAMLFDASRARRAVICVDDAWGRALASRTDVPALTYATLEGVDADVRAVDLRPGADGGIGTRFVLERRTDGTDRVERHELVSPLPGRHYVANTVAVALILESIGIAIEVAAPAIARAAVVPGRMELAVSGTVRGIVDYSHTEDALHQALATVRALPGTARVISVMGAGGDRDRRKRPLMGAAAARLADVVIVTDDNPRTEDPAAIRAAVLAGARDAGSAAEIIEIGDRAAAIAHAAAIARPGDVVLVSGKGAETGQDVNGTILPFDDRIQLRAALDAGRAGEEH